MNNSQIGKLVECSPCGIKLCCIKYRNYVKTYTCVCVNAYMGKLKCSL